MTRSTPAPPAKRRWFAPSLRGLMLAILLVGGLMGWQARQVSIQKRAVATIEALGGTVGYLHQRPVRGIVNPNAEPWGPRWLRRLIGDDFFQTPVSVGVFIPIDTVPPPGVDWLAPILALDRLESFVLDWRITDADLARLAGLKRLRELCLNSAAIGEAGMAHLGKLDRLESLFVWTPANPPTSISARGLAPLARLTRLQSLTLDGVKIDDPAAFAALGKLVNLRDLNLEDSPRHEACLDHLSGLGQLRLLRLSSTEVSDAGLAKIARINDQLEDLTLDGGKGVTDAGLAALANQSRLTHLDLGRLPRVTDVGVARLGDHPALAWLNLNGSAVTDAGLVHLAHYPVLYRILLDDTAITDAGLVHLVAGARITRLDLSGTKITDVGLAQVARMKKIVSLSLARTAITDAGLVSLHGTTTLQGIDLSHTGVTPAGLAALHSALPRLRIMDDDLTAP